MSSIVLQALHNRPGVYKRDHRERFTDTDLSVL